MARGGARARSGPEPDLDAFAREFDKGDWALLPAKWDYPAPEWPLDGVFYVTFGRGEDATSHDYHDREVEHWNKLWTQGQAPMWLINKQETAVALYCRTLTLVEKSMGTSSAPLLSELRRAQEDLGLSTAGLSRNKWRFAKQGEISVAAAESAQPPAPGKGARGKKNADVVDLFAGVTTRAGS
jgi:hypothetical protein